MASKLGFAPDSEDVGEGIIKEMVDGVGPRYLLDPASKAMMHKDMEVSLELEPGLCKVTFLDDDGAKIDDDEWIVFGGQTALPMGVGAGKSQPRYILVQNIRF
jgi:hypothetical protein